MLFAVVAFVFIGALVVSVPIRAVASSPERGADVRAVLVGFRNVSVRRPGASAGLVEGSECSSSEAVEQDHEGLGELLPLKVIQSYRFVGFHSLSPFLYCISFTEDHFGLVTGRALAVRTPF